MSDFILFPHYFYSCVVPIILINYTFQIGNWKEQLQNLCKHIDKMCREKKKSIARPSEYEWWAWWGIIFAACPAGKSGKFLFQNISKHGFKSLVLNRVDFGHGPDGLNIMSWNRFKILREAMPFSFYDHSGKDDPYHPIKLLIDGFNDNRKKNIASSIVIIIDESMSNLQPRTTKTSLLPNISFIFRKPKPLGSELKVRLLL